MTSLKRNVQSALPIISQHACHMVAARCAQRGVLAASLFIHPNRSFPAETPTELPNKPTAVIQPKPTPKTPTLLHTDPSQTRFLPPKRARRWFSGRHITDNTTSACNGRRAAISMRLVSRAGPRRGLWYQPHYGPLPLSDRARVTRL